MGLAELTPISDRLAGTQKINELISAHLKGVTTRTEDAAMAILEKVSRVDGEVSALSHELGRAISECEQIKNEGLMAINALKSAMDDMQGYMLRREQDAREDAKKVAYILTETKKLSDLTHDMNRMSIQGTCLALNAAAQAAHAGEHGRGFKVVSNEMRNISDSLKTIAKSIDISIEQVVDQVEVQVKGNDLEHSHSEIEADLEMLASFSSQLGDIVQFFDRYDAMTVQTFTSLSSSTQEVGKSVLDIMASFQFQDITRQEIEAAQTMLMQINSSFSEALEVIDDPAALAALTPLDINKISDSYVMSDQRKVHQDIFDDASVDDSENNKAPDIDFF